MTIIIDHHGTNKKQAMNWFSIEGKDSEKQLVAELIQAIEKHYEVESDYEDSYNGFYECSLVIPADESQAKQLKHLREIKRLFLK